MSVDVAAATNFLATHGRILDRRRLGAMLGEGTGAAVLAAVQAYRNADGGYGWGLEPDLRSPESQPAGALHAFEAMADAGPLTTPDAGDLCDWLAAVSLPDGGLPFALPVQEPAGCAPWWAGADTTTSSLQITAAVAAEAHRVARHDAAVAGHPWLGRATTYCCEAIAALAATPNAIELMFALRLLDAAADDARTPALARDLARLLPADGIMHVAGGTEDEAMRPLDFTPNPGGPVRTLFDPDVVTGDLRRLAAEQQPDGGWPVVWATSSPASALEWRGHLTVRALAVLGGNGMLG